MIAEWGLAVSMRDGVSLATDVYRPADAGPLPVLLLRTPYDASLLSDKIYELEPLRAIDEGFVAVLQDTRGRNRSDGIFAPLLDDARDGADTIAWAAAQPWCSGVVGMVGGSYNGMVQFLAAAERPPALGAVAPFATGDPRSCLQPSGMLRLNGVTLWAQFAALEERTRKAARGEATEAADEALARTARMHPLELLREMLEPGTVFGDLAASLRPWLEPSASDYWRRVRALVPTVPALHICGWYDGLLSSGLDLFTQAREQGPDAGQHLIVGPWAHGGGVHGTFPEHDFGPLASTTAIDLLGYQLRFARRYLARADVELPAVRVFAMGPNEWRTYDSWPPPGVVTRRLFLDSDGEAGTGLGGRLAPIAPSRHTVDSYRYDPADPTPTLGGSSVLTGMVVVANMGPRDQRSLEQRADVLRYTSAALQDPVEVTGSPRIVLHAATGATDTAFFAKLVDVAPDGRAIGVCEGIIRAIHRNGVDVVEPVTPGAVERYEIRLGATHWEFAAGHRIRLHVS